MNTQFLVEIGRWYITIKRVATKPDISALIAAAENQFAKDQKRPVITPYEQR